MVANVQTVVLITTLFCYMVIYEGMGGCRGVDGCSGIDGCSRKWFLDIVYGLVE
jgi:hypothetical protein